MGKVDFTFFVVGGFVFLRQGLNETQATLKSSLPWLSLVLNLWSPASTSKVLGLELCVTTLALAFTFDPTNVGIISRYSKYLKNKISEWVRKEVINKSRPIAFLLVDLTFIRPEGKDFESGRIVKMCLQLFKITCLPGVT